MKYISPIIAASVLAFVTLPNAYAVESAVSGEAELVIEFTGFEPTSGTVLVAVFDSENGWDDAHFTVTAGENTHMIEFHKI